MIDLKEIAERKESLKAAKAEANAKVLETKTAAAKARGEANRAVGQKLPNAAEAQALATATTEAHNLAKAEYKTLNDAYQAILKEENDAIKENQAEASIQDTLSSYDVAVTEGNEYFGVFYDANSRYVGFDIGINDRAEASFNISNRDDLEKVIATLTAISARM